MLYCPNYSCQTPNSESHKYCQKCRTPLPKHYLWAVGEGVDDYRPGDLLGDRFLCKNQRIFLDTKPGLVSSSMGEVPEAFVPYMRLSPYQLHVPQVYEWVRLQAFPERTVLLLDRAAISVPVSPAQRTPSEHSDGIQLLPTLSQVWEQASALRQLNWLWQIAQLWQPLKGEGATTSLLDPTLVRVEGSLLRLLELHIDNGSTQESGSFQPLGQQWLQWAGQARPEVQPFITQLSQQLIQGQIYNAEQLITQLDQALEIVGQGQSRMVQLATRTDQGPGRQRNEDACFPPSGTFARFVSAGQTYQADTAQSADSAAFPVTSPLVIVCDGIGGHQGGDVASNLAIETIRQQLGATNLDKLDPVSLTLELENAVCVANDLLSQRNDSEQRRERQRMGTTLVMAFVRGHELYVTNVGDSRAYWITQRGCHQLTLDDDIASREVRLGYSPYREAVIQPSAGSLVQALGMSASTSLHPTVQRLVLDEDGIFLLCSDGLSDGDRVEEYWDSVILPALHEKQNLAVVSQRLVDIANTQNGHDNVTVGLLFCKVSETQAVAVPPEQVTLTPAPTQLQSEPPTLLQTAADSSNGLGTASSTAYGAEARTQLVASISKKQGIASLLFSIAILLGLTSVLAYLLVPGFSNRVDLMLSSNSEPEPGVVAPTEEEAIAPETPAPLELGSYVEIVRAGAEAPDQAAAEGTASESTLSAEAEEAEAEPNALPDPASPAAPRTVDSPESSDNTAASNASNRGVTLVLQPEQGQNPFPPTATTANQGTVAVGSILQIMGKRELPGESRWVLLRLCSAPGRGDLAEESPPSNLSIEGNPPSQRPSLSSPTPSPVTDPKRLQPGETGWIPEVELLPLVEVSSNLTAADRGVCAPSTDPSAIAPSSSPSPNLSPGPSLSPTPSPEFPAPPSP